MPKDWNNVAELEATRKAFIERISFELATLNDVAAMLSGASDKRLVAGGLTRIVEGTQAAYLEKLMQNCSTKEFQERIAKAFANLSEAERPSVLSRFGSFLSRVGLGVLLGPIHYSIKKYNLIDNKTLAVGGKTLSASKLV